MSPPPHWDLTDLSPVATLQQQGFALLTAARAMELAQATPAALERLGRFWDDLPPDAHLRDGGRYRARRHASLRLSDSGTDILESVPRAHWQPTEYNALHGGYLRRFAPVSAQALGDPTLIGWITGIARLCAACAGHPLPFVEVHQFRIDTSDGIGRPTPEGAHRDGVDYVAVILIARSQVRGGETRVFEAAGPSGLRFTMTEPGSALLLDDHRVIHETTPLQPDGGAGYRDTLVLTYRREGFLDPAA